MDASSLMAQLNSDPEYVAKANEAKAKHEAAMEELRRAEAPVVAALREAGCAVGSIWDLVNSDADYASVLPVLLDHLQRDYPPAVREGIARAMAVPASKFAWNTLLRLFRHEFDPNPNGVKWAIGAALAAAVDDAAIGDLIALVKDRRHGENRVVLIEALSKSKSLNARVALEEGRSDPQLTKEITRVLDRQRHQRSRSRGRKQ